MDNETQEMQIMAADGVNLNPEFVKQERFTVTRTNEEGESRSAIFIPALKRKETGKAARDIFYNWDFKNMTFEDLWKYFGQDRAYKILQTTARRIALDFTEEATVDGIVQPGKFKTLAETLSTIRESIGDLKLRQEALFAEMADLGSRFDAKLNGGKGGFPEIADAVRFGQLAHETNQIAAAIEKRQRKNKANGEDESDGVQK